MARSGKLATLSVAALIAAALPASAQASPTEPLGHAGRWITDAAGKVVILHGFNTVPVNEPVLPGDIGMGPDNARWLARNGFNTVRLGFYYARVEPEPGVFDDGYLRAYRRTQGELARRGIFTLLDVHQDQLHPRYGTGGVLPSRGFPEWFLKDDGQPNTLSPYPQGYLTNPALNRAYDSIWNDFDAGDGRSVQAHFAAGWRRIARMFRDRPGLLGYDIFNEPWPGSAAASCASPLGCPPGGFDQTLLTDFTRRIVGALRRADGEHLIFYEPNLLFDYGAATQVGDPGDTNAGFAFHDYCLTIVVPGLPSAEPCALEEALVIDNAEAQAERTGDALLLSEFGPDLAVARRITELADEHMVSWQFWDYYGDHPGSLHIAASPALIRPYPRLVAGTPLRWSWDEGSRTFEFAYTTERATGEGAVSALRPRFPAGSRTEVFVPARNFPDGYGAEVEGARVVSKPGAPLLVLRSRTGADEVLVQLTPRQG